MRILKCKRGEREREKEREREREKEKETDTYCHYPSEGKPKAMPRQQEAKGLPWGRSSPAGHECLVTPSSTTTGGLFAIMLATQLPAS